MNVKIQQLIGKVKLGTKRNAPELLLGLGLVTGTACVVMSSRASVKAVDINSALKKEKNKLEELINEEGLTEAEAKETIAKMYGKYALSLAKEYAIPVGLYAITVLTIFKSYKIQKDRQIALSSALAACTAAYSTLLTKIRNGAAAGLTAKEVVDGLEAKAVLDTETGEITYETTQGEMVKGLYTTRFDKYSPYWEKDKYQNLATLRSEQCWANDLLALQGYVFLNDIYSKLGLPRTKAGQSVGWIYQKNGGVGDGFIDFGIQDTEDLTDYGFCWNAFNLEFNVDGDILHVLQ